jgi:hypothetical protein
VSTEVADGAAYIFSSCTGVGVVYVGACRSWNVAYPLLSFSMREKTGLLIYPSSAVSGLSASPT